MKVEFVFNSFYQKSNFKRSFFSTTNIFFSILINYSLGRVEATLQVRYASNTTSVKSACAKCKVLMVQTCNNDILEGLAVADPPKP
jgi:hypothetical protein